MQSRVAAWLLDQALDGRPHAFLVLRALHSIWQLQKRVYSLQVKLVRSVTPLCPIAGLNLSCRRGSGSWHARRCKEACLTFLSRVNFKGRSEYEILPTQTGLKMYHYRLQTGLIQKQTFVELYFMAKSVKHFGLFWATLFRLTTGKRELFS